jgi:hypothetical protein
MGCISLSLILHYSAVLHVILTVAVISTKFIRSGSLQPEVLRFISKGASCTFTQPISLFFAIIIFYFSYSRKNIRCGALVDKELLGIV